MGQELGWAKVKGALKDFGARTHDALDVAIRRSMDLIGADRRQSVVHSM